ncbi:hypothetical protein [Flavobacterium sp.]|uniref:hypothetical protein n=1 Tax=Flavobacterium sp. TaxID=239 RepID=UPI00375040DB
MKKLFLLLFLSVSLFSFSQSQVNITSKKCISKKGFHLKLKSILNDSRCPENVVCAWAGEVSVVVEVYNDKKFVEEKKIVFNNQNLDKNTMWFENYYPKKIKTISVLPYPKVGVDVDFKKKFIQILFED